MSTIEKAKQEFDEKLEDATKNVFPALTPNAKEYVIYEKLLELEKKIEQLKIKERD